jgi:hypothetical protein
MKRGKSGGFTPPRLSVQGTERLPPWDIFEQKKWEVRRTLSLSRAFCGSG